MRQQGRGRRRLQSYDRLDLVSIDLVGPFPATERGNTYILSIQDVFSRFARFVPVVDSSAEAVGRALVEHWYSVFLSPKMLVMDRGPAFKSALLREICRLLRTQRSHSSAYNPSANKVERVHRYLNEHLRTLCMEEIGSWDLMAPLVAAQYNAGFSVAVGMSPFQAMFGMDPLVSLSHGALGEEEAGIRTPSVARSALYARMLRVAATARAWQEADALKAFNDRSVAPGGDWVPQLDELVWFHRLTSDRHPGGKGIKRMHMLPGPYRVLQYRGDSAVSIVNVHTGVRHTAALAKLSPVMGPAGQTDGLPAVDGNIIIPDDFVPAEIVGSRILADGVREWSVRWQGFSDAELSWESSDVLDASPAGRALLAAGVQLAKAQARAAATGVTDLSAAGLVDNPDDRVVAVDVLGPAAVVPVARVAMVEASAATCPYAAWGLGDVARFHSGFWGSK
jgi:transposase InsO family protein